MGDLIRRTLGSSVGRKYFAALTGLLLVGFTIQHLLGNLLLLKPDGVSFNMYAHGLSELGFLLTVAEYGLLGLFLAHIGFGIWITGTNRKARPQKYQAVQSKGGPSRSNLGSRNMIISGAILMLFVIIHVLHIRFGPGIEEGYIAHNITEAEVRDLHRLVLEIFQSPFWVGFYVLAMGLLAVHVKHGFWSAFQSLGAAFPRYSWAVHILGLVIAALLLIGFVALPVLIFFEVPEMFS